MRVLFLSHCSPDAPDKGEKIRAHHILLRLSHAHELHLVSFARRASEVEALEKFRGKCASLFAEELSTPAALARAAIPFALGGCLNTLFYHSPGIARRVRELAAEKRFDAALVYSTPMAQYVPPGTPYVLDMQDVDSEKWFQYGSRRFPGWLYRMEAARLRRKEIEFAKSAARTYFVTRAEEMLFREFAGDVRTGYIENGWGADRHDPARIESLPELAGRRYLVFIGSMDYYPNAEGAVWFARNIFPALRRRDPGLEFIVVGRSPGKAVRALSALPGITVTGSVPDPRPYLKDCLAALAPLQLARGIQLKLIEALATGKPVLASPAVARTLGGVIPPGVTVCKTVDDYWTGLHLQWSATEIRETVARRFDGYRNLEELDRELEALDSRCTTS
jgi:sugar transferase (PEP-CTERM/EpsH1 system associated)